MRPGLIALVTAASTALAGGGQAEKTVNWRIFRAADGLASPACASVAVDSKGKVLVSHPDLPLLTEYDGYAMTKLPAPSGGFAHFYTSPAGQMWTINREGIQEFREGEWLLHPPTEFGMDARGMSNEWFNEPVLCPVRQGLVLLLLPDRLVQFSSEAGHIHSVEVVRQAKDTALGSFVAMAPARDGGFWVSGARGVAKMKGTARGSIAQNVWRDFPAPEAWQTENFRAIHEGTDGRLTVLARSTTNREQVLMTCFEGQIWSAMKAVKEPLQHAWRGIGKSWWAVTQKRLLEYSDGASEPLENREISPRQFFDVAVESADVFWLASSDGLFRHTPSCWQSGNLAVGNAIESVSADPDGGIWFIDESGLHWCDQERQERYLFPASMAAGLKTARAMYPMKNRRLAIETAGGLVKFDATSKSFRIVEGERGTRLRPLGFTKEGILALQSEPDVSATSEGVRLHAYDGTELRDSGLTLPAEAGMRRLSALFVTQNGDTWISSTLGTALMHDRKWRFFSSKEKSAPEAATIFLELANGKIWCAAEDRVWEFDGKDWLALRRGFDGISAMVQSRDGSIWLASNNGVYRFFQGTWIENGIEDGLPAMEVRGLCEDKSDRLWAATSGGLSLFQPKADTDPPRTMIRDLPSQELHVPEGASLGLSYGAQDKWKFTARGRLLYSEHLDGRDWSPFSEKDSATFADLSAGKHYFQVRAMDRNGNIDLQPASLEFVVLIPWYREARLVFISSAGAAIALFFAALAFNRHRRLRHSYAEVEKKVAQRTVELERANRELLHSQKMNALGTLAAGIAHDFNNILSIIKGSAQIIEENIDDPKKIGTRVERIKTVVEQGAGIVKAMLGFSRESGQDSGLCDLNEAVRDTIKLLGDRFLREVQITFEPADELPGVQCSKDLIQQILLNFIFNAAESMAAAKKISLATSVSEDLPGNVVLWPTKGKAYASVSVQDKGGGIAPEILPRIFEPFFTTKAMSTRRGTGLGLSMVYEFAKKMNAGLAVSSVVGQGSAFTLILPVPDAARPSTSPTDGLQKEDPVTMKLL
jgi:signal transduction histidine kinase/ligand-binding sensor domain-containing protein